MPYETITGIKTVFPEIITENFYFANRSTNAGAESFIAKVKAFRSQFRGVTDIQFFLFRLSKLCA